MPTDYFQILDLPRLPWLDEAIVREHFQRLAANRHPDVAGGSHSDFSEINQAWQVLRSPASRLRHYLELEHPEAVKSAESSAPVFPDLFMDIAEVQRKAIAHYTLTNATTSPLARAVQAHETSNLRSRIDELLKEVTDRIGDVQKSVQASGTSPATLAQSLRELIFLEKWAAQLRETQSQLG
jgi:DnaJ-class molecular chaperone